MFRQARWSEPLVFEIGISGREGNNLRNLNCDYGSCSLPENLIREELPSLPQISEPEIARHFTHLSQMNFGVDQGFYPLGSCTMKYNPKINERLATSDGIHWVHPYQPEETMQGTLEIMYKLSSFLAEITGMDKISLQPAAGAHGELAGTLMMRRYHEFRGEMEQRTEMIVPDSAHGTNPSSASMAGFKVVVVPTSKNGVIDIEALKVATSSRTAGLMLTNPNTLGIFERDIREIESIVHESGGLLYYDGANLNAIIGKTNPGVMGFDLVHLNLHKTFSTPHGGGGPGAGPIGVKSSLVDFLPVPIIEIDDQGIYYLDYDLPHTIGKVRSYYGNVEVLIRAFIYILTMGCKGLMRASETAVLNANYLAKKMFAVRGFKIPYYEGQLVKHEFVISCSSLKSETGISARQVAKRLLDYGIHAPTVYFPSIVDESLMIEPTESEPLEGLDRFAQIIAHISSEAYSNPEIVLSSPRNTSVGLVNEVKASHPKTLCLSWRMHNKRHVK